MRICIVSDGLPFDYGGAQLRAFKHTQHFQSAEGTNAMMVVWNRSAKQVASNSFPAYVHPVRMHFQDVEGTDGIGQLANSILHVGELGARLGALLFAMRREFDLLHVINAASLFSLITVPLAKLLNKPVILETVSLGADDPLTLNERSKHPEQQLFPHRPFKYTLFSQADAFVSKSLALSESCRQAGLAEAKLFQIPNGVNVSKFKPPTSQEKRALRHKLGLDEERIIILFVGVINRLKGVHLLLSAFRQIAPLHSKVQLLLVGPSLPLDGAYCLAVRQRIRKWGLSERVILIDEMVDNVDDYMRASDIFCLPTKREGFPLVVIEAMATGLPVVVSRLEGVTTGIIRSDHEGILVPEGDTMELAKAMADLITDANLRVRLGQAARRRVLLDFTDESVYRQYLKLYHSVLSN